jgi:serine/threonine protein kinase
MSLCINPRCPNPQNPDNILFCGACSSELLLQGRYRAANVLGSGGFGKTYEVKEGSTAKVLKVLMNNSSKAVELFQREAQVLSQLNNDGIPKIEANGYFIFYPKDDPQPLHCMVMEKIDGYNLWNYIKKGGRPIDGDLACRWLIELVEILQQVHERDILHRDIKPQNIMLKPDGKLVLIDFGAVTEEQGTELATQAGGGGSGTEAATNAGAGTSISSQGYTPFEQLHGQAVPQSDFFALGRTFVYLLTAKEPVDKSIYDAFNDELNWRQFAPTVSSDLADLIDKMMARLPRDRPKNAAAILQNLTTNPSVNPSSSRPSESSPAYSQVPAYSEDQEKEKFQQPPIPKSTPISERISEPKTSSRPVALFFALGILGIIGAIITVNTFSSTIAPAPVPPIPVPPIPDNKCFAEIAGTIRSQPYKADETTIQTSETKLFVTGTETEGGWVQGKLSNGNLAWAHKSVIPNYTQMKSCLEKSGITVTKIGDTPNPNPTKTPTETNSNPANTIISCTTGDLNIRVAKNENGGYTYNAYDAKPPYSQKLVLTQGNMVEGVAGNEYIFKNGSYSYIVVQLGKGGFQLRVSGPDIETPDKTSEKSCE